MGILDKSRKITENFSITKEQLIELIANDLGLPKEELSIRTEEEDVSDNMSRYPNVKFVGVTITRKYESS